MKKEFSQTKIPKAAIRTMAKDLAGIVFEEWEALLTEAEVEEILKRYKEKVPVKEEIPTREAVPVPQPVEKKLIEKIEAKPTEEELKQLEEERRKKEEELRRLEEQRKKEEELLRKKLEEEKRRREEELK